MTTTLSDREVQILTLASHGKTDKQIGAELGLSRSTLNTYWSRIRMKTGGQTRSEMVANVIRQRARAKLRTTELANAELKEEVHRHEIAEEALRRWFEALVDLLDRHPAAVVLVDGEGKTLAANAAFEILWGVERQALVGCCLPSPGPRAALPRSASGPLMVDVAMALRGERPARRRDGIPNGNGVADWTVEHQVVRDNHGQVLGVCSIFCPPGCLVPTSVTLR